MKTVIEVKDLVKRYKELVALDHFALSIKEGEIFGLLGPNGSGKTTTIHCILGLLSYDKGDIQVFGKKMKSNAYDVKRDIGVVMKILIISADFISMINRRESSMWKKRLPSQGWKIM